MLCRNGTKPAALCMLAKTFGWPSLRIKSKRRAINLTLGLLPKACGSARSSIFKTTIMFTMQRAMVHNSAVCSLSSKTCCTLKTISLRLLSSVKSDAPIPNKLRRVPRKMYDQAPSKPAVDIVQHPFRLAALTTFCTSSLDILSECGCRILSSACRFSSGVAFSILLLIKLETSVYIWCSRLAISFSTLLKLKDSVHNMTKTKITKYWKAAAKSIFERAMFMRTPS
mmetsp:Transcript_142413/g.251592  ORF Transcript_142413/g.251592 Transcript_142413/m.251592 type:complete len:226 (+) Transcript_142413:1151-1828(+)